MLPGNRENPRLRGREKGEKPRGRIRRREMAERRVGRRAFPRNAGTKSGTRGPDSSSEAAKNPKPAGWLEQEQEQDAEEEDEPR